MKAYENADDLFEEFKFLGVVFGRTVKAKPSWVCNRQGLRCVCQVQQFWKAAEAIEGPSDLVGIANITLAMSRFCRSVHMWLRHVNDSLALGFDPSSNGKGKTWTSNAKQLRVLESKIDKLALEAPEKEWYTPDEAAALVDRKPFTVREWCRLGRVNAEKLRSGGWRVSRDEVERFRVEGLLPEQKYGWNPRRNR